uniref:Genomic DNA, chromosome 3, clone:P0043E01 n=1 Tax=Oryza sativa subsp. japonica TaxID=39947 RepID=Q9SNL0_ORYSJ|nr:unnamed protein product [Oryza sativa Japonica Group]
MGLLFGRCRVLQTGLSASTQSNSRPIAACVHRLMKAKSNHTNQALTVQCLLNNFRIILHTVTTLLPIAREVEMLLLRGTIEKTRGSNLLSVEEISTVIRLKAETPGISSFVFCYERNQARSLFTFQYIDNYARIVIRDE